MQVVSEKIQIPLEICSFVQKNKLVKAFSIYLYLKCNSSGKVHHSQMSFQHIADETGLKDSSTIKKHLEILIEMNWVGYNHSSGYYFIRSFDYIRVHYLFKSRKAVTFRYQYINKIQEFITGSLIGAEIKNQMFYKEVVVKRKLRTATQKRDVANQSNVSDIATTLPYYGLGIEKIAALLGVQKSRASELKLSAKKAGFIWVKHKYQVLDVLYERDNNLGKMLNENPAFKGKIRFKKARIKRLKCIKVMLQGYDEIKPRLTYKRITKFNNLKGS